jgi:endonuclease/exonuclease/phosphatase family metal-dependent hydrolase
VPLRVVTYNVRSFRAGVGAAVEAVAAEAPDVVMLQEYGPPHRLRAFAKATGMEWASSYGLWNRLRNAVLFRSPWRLAHTDLHRFTRTNGQYRRGFVAAMLENGALRITAVSVHLGLSAGERPRHAGELVAALDPESGPVIVAGDLNEEPEGEAIGPSPVEVFRRSPPSIPRRASTTCSWRERSGSPRSASATRRPPAGLRTIAPWSPTSSCFRGPRA